MAERNSTDHSHSPYFNSLCKALYFDIKNDVHICLFRNPKENGREIETCKGCPNQYSSVTAADIYAARKYYENCFNGLKRSKAEFAEIEETLGKKLKPKVDIKWELDEEEPKALKMFYKMNPTLCTPGRKPRTY